jgi:CHAD domain-containing protein
LQDFGELSVKSDLHFRLPNGHTREQIDALLGKKYTSVVDGSVAEEWTFYDTFDWRLFGKFLVIYQCSRELILHPLTDGRDGAVRPPCDRHVLCGSARPVFAWDLPESSLKEQLQQVIKERALLPLVKVPMRSTTCRVLDRSEKTVARLVLTEARLSPTVTAPVLASYLSLRPVRGYRKAFRKLARDLNQNAPVSSLVEDIYLRGLDAIDQRPGSYSGKLDIRLEPSMRSDEATKTIMLHLLAGMRANEPGIREDIDTEFMHDYRVAIRRTRSALSQIRNVFPENVTEHYKGEFRQLGQRTNQLRDLDVYLLAEPAYRAMLPHVLQDDIAPLFDHLRLQRAGALRDVIDGLDSDTYVLALQEWESFLTTPIAASDTGANAGIPIIDLSRQRIYRRFRRVVKDGKRILKKTEDEKLHALRIECKKLRYLLEFFASLFPPKEMARLIRQLKRLQDNLGAFTDLSVQQEYLLDIATELPVDDSRSRRALVAVGALVQELARRQQLVKDDFARTFSRFAEPANQKTYRKLFANKPREKTS